MVCDPRISVAHLFSVILRFIFFLFSSVNQLFFGKANKLIRLSNIKIIVFSFFLFQSRFNFVQKRRPKCQDKQLL